MSYALGFCIYKYIMNDYLCYLNITAIVQTIIPPLIFCSVPLRCVKQFESLELRDTKNLNDNLHIRRKYRACHRVAEIYTQAV